METTDLSLGHSMFYYQSRRLLLNLESISMTYNVSLNADPWVGLPQLLSRERVRASDTPNRLPIKSVVLAVSLRDLACFLHRCAAATKESRHRAKNTLHISARRSGRSTPEVVSVSLLESGSAVNFVPRCSLITFIDGGV